MKSVLILEDNAGSLIWMQGIVAEVFPGAHVSVVTSISQAREAILARTGDAFDLALVDLNLPDGDGQDVIRLLAREMPGTQAVVTTVMGSDASVVSALSAGAVGYLLKSDTAAIVATQLRQLALGSPALSPSIARRIMRHFSFTGPVADNPESLTQRETEVLGLIAQGMRVSETAQQMGIADSTVSTYIKSIYRKLGISSRAEASFEAARRGLLGR